MSKLPVSDKYFDDEIDLLSFIQTVWEGKWKIGLIIAVSLLSVFGFNFIKPNTSFIASTKIKPITSFEFDKYSLFNARGVFVIKRDSLRDLYIEEIQEGTLLETAVDKFNLINKDDFVSESDYKDAIEKFVSEIEVTKLKKDNKQKASYHALVGEYDDKEKWKELLTFVNNEANRKVKANIINRFATIVSIQNQKKDFALEDLVINIDNVKKDYDTYTKNRLAFLAEQAAIARKLNIEKNTIAAQRFSSQNTFVTNVKTDAPFYLRGYIAIEEEIEQTTTRKDKDAFTKDLIKLEQQKRVLEQDETIRRAVSLFNKTPLNQSDFQATIVKVATTEFQTDNNRNLYYILAIVLGGIIGVVYVLMANAIKNSRTQLTNSLN